jgi:hypothetical protein
MSSCTGKFKSRYESAEIHAAHTLFQWDAKTGEPVLGTIAQKIPALDRRRMLSEDRS